MLLNIILSNFSAISLREQVTFDKMKMMFTLSQNNIFSWIFTALGH